MSRGYFTDTYRIQTNELAESLGSRALELEQHNTQAAETIQQTVDTLFRSDDKLLNSLQKLGWELETEDAEEQRDVVTLRETCARFVCPLRLSGTEAHITAAD